MKLTDEKVPYLTQSVYGNQNRLPIDGVKELIHHWKYHDLASDEICGLNFASMNKVA